MHRIKNVASGVSVQDVLSSQLINFTDSNYGRILASTSRRDGANVEAFQETYRKVFQSWESWDGKLATTKPQLEAACNIYLEDAGEASTTRCS